MRGDRIGPGGRLAVLLGLLVSAGACIPAGGGGGGDDEDGGADVFVDPDDGVPPRDMFIDPDDGVPPGDMFVDPDDGVPPGDMFVDPDDGVPMGDERCNGEDDDADGLIDEDWPALGERCAIGVGQCEAEGVVVCTPDGRGTVCGAMGLPPVAEFCNGFDDDCDGLVDEVEPLPCDTGAAGRCAGGLEQCVGGSPVCIPQLDPRGEVCDGQDDDCDGAIDEDVPQGEGCQTGLPGLCADGVEACVDGVPLCLGPEPQEEVCEAVDEDCDGAVDEGGVCDPCFEVECPPGLFCEDGECVEGEPCGDNDDCPPGHECFFAQCVPVDPGDATPIGQPGGTVRIVGDLGAADPTWQRLDQGCEGRADGDFYFDALPLINQTGAAQRVDVLGTWGGVDGYLHIFDEGFDPAVDAGCLIGDDDFGDTTRSQVVGVIFDPGQVRVVVVSTFDPEALMPGYVIDITTQGEP